METLKRFFTRSDVILAIGIWCVVGLAILGFRWDLNKSEWAAWVQAIGATVGLGIAIGVPYRQRKDAITQEVERQQAEARRVQLSIKDELQALQDTFSGPNVTYLRSIPVPGIFDKEIPTPAERFPIYVSVMSRLTLIADDSLRSEIIRAYAVAAALPMQAQANNRLLAELREIEVEIAYRPDEFQHNRLNHQNIRLIESCANMQTTCEHTIKLVNAVIKKL